MITTNRVNRQFSIRYGFIATVVALLGSAAYVALAPGHFDAEAAPNSDIAAPQGYRDCGLISIARVGGPVNDVRAKVGNDVAMRAIRNGQNQFPDGSIIARLAWDAAPSEETNNALRPTLERVLGPDVARKT